MRTHPLRSLALAGGASTRMGFDKALMSFHGKPQVRRLVDMLETIAPPVYVSVRRAQEANPAFAGLRLLADQTDGIGPIEGLVRAFAEAPDCAWLVVAVDMPFLTEAAIRRLLSFRDPERFATAYRNPATDRPEPVCAIYEPRIFPVLQKAKVEQRYSLMILRDVPIRLVEPEREEELRNINHPDEYRRAGGRRFPPTP